MTILELEKIMNFKLLIPAVLVLIGAYNFNSQKIFAQELDPNILWVADSSIGRIDGFAVHPNGNIFAYRNGSNDGPGQPVIELKVFEIDGNTGKLIRELPKFSEDVYLESIDISDDGRYLATSYTYTNITDLNSGVSKNLMKGVRAKFLPNSSKIAILGPKNTDSSIVILDLVTEQRTYIKTEEGIHKIAFSPDGSFFATGGSLYTGIYPSYTSLKLWDAHTNKLINELERTENTLYSTIKIEFSPDNKSVAFFGEYKIRIFDTETYNQIKHYDDYEISSFTFISNELIGIQSKTTSVVRLSDDHIKNLFEFKERAGFMYVNSTHDILYAGTGIPEWGGSIVAFDLNKIFSSVETKSENTTIQASYQKGILTISGFQSVSSKVNLEIFDINGKLVSKLDLKPNDSEFTIPLKLPNGTYLLNLQDGRNVYSGKFLVVE